MSKVPSLCDLFIFYTVLWNVLSIRLSENIRVAQKPEDSLTPSFLSSITNIRYIWLLCNHNYVS